MCILFLAIHQHPDYPLIICANRDELHQRPTRAAQFWSQYPHLLAGKDLQAGGSWLGINKNGYFAAITNIRTGNKVQNNKKSRGELVTEALRIDSPVNEHWLLQHSDDYNAFNLIYGSAQGLFCYNSVNHQQIRLNKGFHAISNGAMDDIWPKMAKGEMQLETLVQSSVDIAPAKLLSILRDQSRALDEQLPETGISIEWERLLSSIFICSAEYGTRSSSLIMQHQDATIYFTEVEYNQQGEQVNQNSFEFSPRMES